MRTEFVVWVNGTEVHRGSDLEDAIRAWDGNPTVYEGGSVPGGITVQTWNDDDIMIRDGWILHVYENGQVFLNPNLNTN